MADMYDASCSSSPPPSRTVPALESDEISLLLHHLLHSSSYPPSSMSDKGNNPPLLFSSTSPTTSTTGFFPGETPPEDHHRPDAITASVSTRRFTAMENDLEDYDCESEEFLDASEGLMKAVPSRTSSKRSRAAEVHNLSEKRRRSRINEKMKALQKLIPNSNKTDKASMLDEAIEYLKQLQLQLQMLSMRNGLSSHPMYLPGVLQPLQLPQMQMAFEGNGYTGIGTRAVNQKTLTQTIFDLSNHCTSAHQPIGVSTMTNVPNSETSFRLGSSIRAHLGPFQRATSSEVICREDMLPQQQLDIGHSSRNPTENKTKRRTTSSLPSDTRASALEDGDSLEAWMPHRERSQGILNNVDCNQILLQHLDGREEARLTMTF